LGWGWSQPYEPFVFDQHLVNGNGQRLLDDFANNSVALGVQLRGGGNGVYFAGAEASAANGGAAIKLYAPWTWNEGASIYHVDEIYNGTENDLMTYSISQGQVTHDPGPVILGVMADLGWTTLSEPDLIVWKGVTGPYDPAPGDPVTYTLSIENAGTLTATQVVVSDVLPAAVLAAAWSSSGALSGVTLQGGTRYVWNLPSLAPGAKGTITIVGTIDPSLPAGYALWNSASVSCDEQENLANNASTALVGGHRTTLPLVSKESQ
jgi:uncharacterized repeat protein (TIGR01451 family)